MLDPFTRVKVIGKYMRLPTRTAGWRPARDPCVTIRAMLFLAFKRTFPRGFVMSTAVAIAVLIANYFQTKSIAWWSAGLIFAIALAATFLLYVPVEYHNLKADRKRAELAKRIRTMS